MAASILVQSRFDIQLGVDMLNCVLTIAARRGSADCTFRLSIRDEVYNYGIVFNGRADTTPACSHPMRSLWSGLNRTLETASMRYRI